MATELFACCITAPPWYVMLPTAFGRNDAAILRATGTGGSTWMPGAGRRILATSWGVRGCTTPCAAVGATPATQLPTRNAAAASRTAYVEARSCRISGPPLDGEAARTSVALLAVARKRERVQSTTTLRRTSP